MATNFDDFDYRATQIIRKHSLDAAYALTAGESKKPIDVDEVFRRVEPYATKLVNDGFPIPVVTVVLTREVMRAIQDVRWSNAQTDPFAIPEGMMLVEGNRATRRAHARAMKRR